MPFGAHMSIGGGVANAFAHGQKVGCETMQIFSKNQRQWEAKPYTPEEIARFQAEQQRTGIRPVVVHASYLINLASPKDGLWEKSIAGFADEMERCTALEIPYLVVHPGAHTGSGEEAGLHRIGQALNRLLNDSTTEGVTILLETTAGQGTTLGYSFEHLARLVELVDGNERVQVCIDTCHLFAAGYDIRTAETYEATFAACERVLGSERVQVFHLNDSQKELGSRADRHDHIGKGCLGLEPFRLLVNDPRFHDTPMIIETPKGEDLAEDIENLALLRSLRSSTPRAESAS